MDSNFFRDGYELTHYAGEDDSTTVPEDIGRLELIIRRLHELDLGDPGSDSSDHGMSGGPSTRIRKRVASQSDEENSENDEDDSEDNSEDDEPEYSDDSYGGRAVCR